jgi:hypothetical protein
MVEGFKIIMKMAWQRGSSRLFSSAFAENHGLVRGRMGEQFFATT